MLRLSKLLLMWSGQFNILFSSVSEGRRVTDPPYRRLWHCRGGFIQTARFGARPFLRELPGRRAFLEAGALMVFWVSEIGPAGA